MSTKHVFLYCLFFLTTELVLYASDFVTITNPATDSTVTGFPLIIAGSSSRPAERVRVTINTTETGSATADINGDWSLTSDTVFDGEYSVTADLIVNNDILAAQTNYFTVANQTIQITSPADGDQIFVGSMSVIGSSSTPLAIVNLLVDGNLEATTSTDSAGNWSLPYTLTSNGSHTLLVQLLSAMVPIATSSITINSAIPIFLPAGKSEMRVISGTVPTVGSGTGSGYAYSNSGSVTTITFTPAFSAIPSVVATGFRSSGASTVTISSVSQAAVNMAYSTNTTNIQFTAILFS